MDIYRILDIIPHASVEEACILKSDLDSTLKLLQSITGGISKMTTFGRGIKLISKSEKEYYISVSFPYTLSVVGELSSAPVTITMSRCKQRGLGCARDVLSLLNSLELNYLGPHPDAEG